MSEAVDIAARADATKAHDRIDRMAKDISENTKTAALAAQAIDTHVTDCVAQRQEQKDAMRSVNRKLWSIVLLLVSGLLGAFLNMKGVI